MGDKNRAALWAAVVVMVAELMMMRCAMVGGQVECVNEDVEIWQTVAEAAAQTWPPTVTVVVNNTCNCRVASMLVNCDYLPQAAADPSLLRSYGGLCELFNGDALPASTSRTFTYRNDLVDLDILSAYFSPPCSTSS